eukprot:NODE_414_length_7911_cov_0.926011.p3 type:complete len:310 gc:universal NODE_414_length_7911_cov_0.926011:2774-1845(-)
MFFAIAIAFLCRSEPYPTIDLKCYFRSSSNKDSVLMKLKLEEAQKWQTNVNDMNAQYYFEDCQYKLRLWSTGYDKPNYDSDLKFTLGTIQDTSFLAYPQNNGMMVVNGFFKCHIKQDFQVTLSCWTGDAFKTLVLKSNRGSEYINQFDTISLKCDKPHCEFETIINKQLCSLKVNYGTLKPLDTFGLVCEDVYCREHQTGDHDTKLPKLKLMVTIGQEKVKMKSLFEKETFPLIDQMVAYFDGTKLHVKYRDIDAEFELSKTESGELMMKNGLEIYWISGIMKKKTILRIYSDPLESSDTLSLITINKH